MQASCYPDSASVPKLSLVRVQSGIQKRSSSSEWLVQSEFGLHNFNLWSTALLPVQPSVAPCHVQFSLLLHAKTALSLCSFASTGMTGSASGHMHVQVPAQMQSCKGEHNKISCPFLCSSGPRPHLPSPGGRGRWYWLAKRAQWYTRYHISNGCMCIWNQCYNVNWHLPI